MDTVSIKTSSFKLSIAFLGFLLTIAIGYGFYAGYNFLSRQISQQHAVHEIKQRLTHAHLWLEELMCGDQVEEMSKVDNNFNRAISLSSALLQGGELSEAEIIYPLKDITVREEIRTILNQIKTLKEMSAMRYESSDLSALGRFEDQKFDNLFYDITIALDRLETRFWILYEQKAFLLFTKQGILLLICLFLAFSIGLFFRKFERTRIANLQEAHTQIKKQLSELSALNTIAKTVSRELVTKNVANAALENIVTIIEPDFAIIYLREGERLIQLASKASIPNFEIITPEHKAVGQCLCGIAAQGTPVYSDNIQEDHRCTLNECKEAGIRSFAALPLLKSGKKIIGVLGLAFTKERRLADLADFVETIAEQIALGLQNCLHHEQEQKNAERVKLNEERLEAIWQMNSQDDLSEHELALYALEEATRLTRSKGGYFHFYDEETQTISLNVWTKTAMAACNTAEQGHYPLAKAGIWADSIRQRKAVVHNDYENNSRKKGIPEGHFHLLRHLSVPIFMDNKIVAVAGVGNKELPYDDTDIRQLSMLMTDAWKTITRKRTKRALVQSEQRHKEAQKIAKIGHWEFDITSNHLVWSDQLYEIYGIDEHTGVNCHEDFLQYVHPDDRNFVMQTYRDSLHQNRAHDIVHRIKLQNGNIKYVHQLCRTEYDDQGKALRSLGTTQDISQVKEIELQKKRVESQLHQAQKMEAIGTLAGGIAHDFNNILTAIIGFAQLAAYDLTDPDHVAKDIDEVRKAANRAKDLVQQILTFSRKAEKEKHPLQIALVVKEALKLLRSSIPTTIQIKQDISATAVVLADPTQIHQIIMNLCTNAYHAMQETGGILSVSLKEVDIDATNINGLELSEGRYLKLTVGDNGKGMTKDILAKIFDPYFTTKGKGQGTGLGLAVAHGVVKEHGGCIRVYSEPGQGTTFHVYFPIYTGDAAIPSVKQPQHPPVGGNESIMIVDDETQILKAAREFLTRYGYKVKAFTNAVQAVQEFQQNPHCYDLAITDMTMPYMTGAQLAVKLIETRPHLPVILCTGHSELTNREHALAIGIKEYIEKPIEFERLLLIVRTVLDRAKLAGLRILSVDDDPFSHTVINEFLKRQDCVVVNADSAEEALKVLQQQEEGIDLIITDQNMPDMTGIELAEHLAQSEKKIPVLLVTGEGEEAPIGGTHASGISAILGKPIDENLLVAAIVKAIQTVT